MRLDRGLRIELVAGGETRSLERLRRLLPRERVGETYPRLCPCAARERRTPLLDRPVWLVRSRGATIVRTAAFKAPVAHRGRNYREAVPLALITGAARANSIAAGITPRLTADGWDVVTSDLENADIVCDLSEPTGPQTLVDAVNRDHGAISALVLSHAHDVQTGIYDTTADSFDRHVAINARASLLLIAAFARQIPESGGAIVALTSDATTGNLPYGASKGALDRIVISAARELGPRAVSANVLNPGPIDTGWMDDALRSALMEQHPLGRLGTPSDIAGVVSFLVSPEGRWVSGQLLHADGAFSARF